MKSMLVSAQDARDIFAMAHERCLALSAHIELRGGAQAAKGNPTVAYVSRELERLEGLRDRAAEAASPPPTAHHSIVVYPPEIA